MFLTLLTFISAISISVIAAGYSIIGLATLFAGATTAIIAMGGALEVGKLVAASWLYNNWRSDVPRLLKSYLFIAIIVLVFITSMGIFGFLSKAHLDQVKPTSGNNIKLEQITNQIERQQVVIDRSQKTLTLLDKALEVYIDKEYVTRGLKERAKQEEERTALNNAIENASDKIQELSDKKATLSLAQDKIEAEVGPIKYVAELIYGENAKDNLDKSVRIVILILIFVFDPLAVLLLIAANISLRSRNNVKEEEKTKIEKDYQKEATNAKVRAKRVRDREKVYKGFFKKIASGELKTKDYEEMRKMGLNPDEIKIKLNQIMDLS
jgi:hypothetical protein